MNQTTLFTGGDLLAPAPPHNGSATSRAAAESLTPAHVSRQEGQILFCLSRHKGGMTREELAKATELRLASVCARCNALVARKLLTERGERRGTSGRMVSVLWIARTKGNQC